MKYLKKIKDKIFNKRIEISKEVVQDIRDICLELNDVGYIIFTNQLRYIIKEPLFGRQTMPPYMEILILY